MDENRYLDEKGLVYFYDKMKTELGLYLHKIAFNQEITSPENEPFSRVYLYLVTTDPTPAVTDFGGYNLFGNLHVKLEPSHIISAHGGWKMGERDYYIPVDLCINMQADGTYIEQAVIPQRTATGDYAGASSPEVIIYDSRNFIGDTVTEI